MALRRGIDSDSVTHVCKGRVFFFNWQTLCLIKVEGVSKKFCRSLKKSLWYGMQDPGSEMLGKRHGGKGELRQDEFWALKGVSF